MPSETVGLLGVGWLGEAVALRLLGTGHSLVAFNRNADKLRSVVAQGARPAPRPLDAFDADVVLSFLLDDEAVREVFLDPGLLRAAGQGGDRRVHVCCSTISPGLSRALADAHDEAGLLYVGAPVLGRPPAAAAGQLHIFTGGKPEAVARAAPVLRDLGSLWPMGDSPAVAHVAKIAANFMMSAAMEGMAEAAALVSWEGGSSADLVGMMTQTLLSAPVYQRFAAAYGIGEMQGPPAGLALPLKDNALALGVAKEAGGELPIAQIIRAKLLEAQRKGNGPVETSVVLAKMAREARHQGPKD